MDKCIIAYLIMGSYDQTTLKKVVNKQANLLELFVNCARKKRRVRSATLLIFAIDIEPV